jgi:tetratricopeptide (TPR) repeat protein
LAPKNAGFRSLLADFYARSGYDLKGEGLDAIRKIADQLPKDAEVRASLGWALMSSGQVDAAQKELDQALVLDPTNVRAHYYYALLLQNRGDNEGAIRNYLYVYRDSSDTSFTDLAAGALKRLGYNVDPNNTGS